MNFKYFILISLFFISSCRSFNEQLESPEEILQKASHQKIFFAPYDDVWKAAHATLKYTIAAENQDFGIIETDYIKAVDGWIPPYKQKPDNPSSRYKIVINFAKGQKYKGRDAVRVTIEKKIEVFKDFVSEVKNVTSDGLEEKSIFYRMEREIIISQALNKALAQPDSSAEQPPN